MAVPKRKLPEADVITEGHVNVAVPALSSCTNCGEMTRPHRVCQHCGYFKGVQVVEVKAVLIIIRIPRDPFPLHPPSLKACQYG